MLVANVCYLEYFRRRNMNLLDLLDGCLSWRLYHDNDQMIILNEVSTLNVRYFASANAYVLCSCVFGVDFSSVVNAHTNLCTTRR